MPIKLNERWYIFYGMQLGMDRETVLNTRFGEMLDYIACLAIYNGAEPAKPKMPLEDVLKLE